MGNYFTCGPNEALIISGSYFQTKKKRYIVGGYAYAPWFVSDVQYLSLQLLTAYPYCVNVETYHGVAVTVSAVAHCKIMKELEFLKLAAEQFLGMDEQVLRTNISHTLEGSLRAILGVLTVEEIYKDREMFSNRVRTIATPDMARMGIAIISFTIKDIWDNVDYLNSLGKTQIAAVKRDAVIGEAQANRDAGIREAECEKEANNVMFDMRTRIENTSKMYHLAKAAFDQEVNAAKAEVALAYELQGAKIQQQIRREEIEIDIIERKKQAEIETKEVERVNKELISSVRLPVEASSYEMHTIAEGMKIQTISKGRGESTHMQLLAKSEAFEIEEVGKSEAEYMLRKANVFKTYENAAITSLVLDALPHITHQISMPLNNVSEIVIIEGSDGITSDVNRLLGQIRPSISALTGEINKIWPKN